MPTSCFQRYGCGQLLNSALPDLGVQHFAGQLEQLATSAAGHMHGQLEQAFFADPAAVRCRPAESNLPFLLLLIRVQAQPVPFFPFFIPVFFCYSLSSECLLGHEVLQLMSEEEPFFQN